MLSHVYLAIFSLADFIDKLKLLECDIPVNLLDFSPTVVLEFFMETD